MQCPFCGYHWVTFSQKRGTSLCNTCKLLNVTPEECKRWYDPKLPLNSAELSLVALATNPAPIVTKRLLATLGECQLVPLEIMKIVFHVEYSPACTKPFLVRLMGQGEGKMDKEPAHKTKDVMGYGDTFAEAAEMALSKRKAQKTLQTK